MYACQVPRARNPETADQLLDAAARVLDEEGQAAVTARRLAAEIGTSTMAVYTHFGGMDDLLAHVWRLGFSRFRDALEGPTVTDDSVSDWLTQGWAYRRFALRNPHLYRVMFGGRELQFADHADEAAAMGTFLCLLERLVRCVDAGRLDIDDVHLAGEVVWTGVHGHMTIELSGYFAAQQRDPEVVYAECMRRLALGFGDGRDELERSMTVARRRARRADDQRSVSVAPSAHAVSTR